jgi:hypothetical protein
MYNIAFERPSRRIGSPAGGSIRITSAPGVGGQTAVTTHPPGEIENA